MMTKPSLLQRWFLEPSGRDDGTSWGWQAFLAGWVPALSLVALVFFFSFHRLAYQWNWPSVYKYRSTLLAGWLVTIAISLVSLLLSTLIGLVFALARRSRLLPLRSLGHLYVELVRGTPLLVQILIFFYVVADAF
ncbi:MAG TPA: ABC transporter permease subunit, partial [Dongiaceae bacterium]|nr:ABC transporter permease subunit [Dongiaceae bacterium]